MKYYKTEEGKTNCIILSLGIIGILSGCLSKKIIGETAFTILLSISTSIVASAVVSYIMAGFLYRRNKNEALVEEWGIESLNANRGIINAEVDALFEKHISNLDIIAYGLKSFREAKNAQIRSLLSGGTKVRIITVNPESELLQYKDLDENKVAGSTKASIQELIKWCEALKQETNGQIEVRYINTLPTEVYFRVDSSIFVGPYEIGKESQQTITIRFGRKAAGVMYYSNYFEELWGESKSRYLRKSCDSTEVKRP